MESLVLPRVARGDEAAVRECIARYGNLVWSLVRRLCPDRADAEDAAQEIMIELWKSAGRFDPDRSSESSFVAMIARRRLIDRLRRHVRSPEKRDLSEVPEPANRAHEIMERDREAGLALDALRRLEPESQRIISLVVVEGWTHKEVSEMTGMPLGTVKSHVRRGLARVRKRLASGEGAVR